MKLDGREFTGVDRAITAAQNDYIQAHLALAGVTDLLVELSQTPEPERLPKLRREFIARILLSGRKSSILAGCLTETGKKWTRLEADRNAAIFDELTDAKELEEMSSGLAGIVFAFFQYAEISSKTSPKSSSPNVEVPATGSAERATSATSPQ